jgi:hypothetical protein
VLDPARLAAIARLVDALGGDLAWALTGSAAHALHGLDVPVRDIDVITDAPGALEIERRLREHVVRAVSFSATDSIRSHFGALSLAGVEVELMGDVQTRARNGAWRAPIEVVSQRHFVAVGEHRVPLMPLAHEIEFYEQLGRRERAEQLRALL